MKRPTILLENFLLDARISLRCNVAADIVVIRNRFENEGMSFLTITLPSFGDAFDKALADGYLSPIPSFRGWQRGRALPAFLQGLLRLVFSYENGQILENPSVEAIRFVRQICRFFKKVLLPCSEHRTNAAFERYVQNDQNVYGFDQFPECHNDLSIVAGYLWSDLEVLSRDLYCARVRHGTGATAERLSPNKRYSIKQWPKRGEHLFPLSWFCAHREDATDEFESISILDEIDESPARVVSVPKTLKTPRIICVEPSYMMVRQQSVLLKLVEWLESGRLGFKSIGFTDQTVNKEWARLGSLDGSLATIDLSDASDLVSLDFVKAMFKTCPTFLEYLLESRTSSSRLPDGSLVKLRKFASMGSALCFPIEAMAFFTIVITAMIKDSGRSVTRKRIRDCARTVRIYGDDIIIPTRNVDSVVRFLSLYGMKVNKSKSYYTGFFRESCGGDYYRGHDVTPVYCRRLWTTGTLRKPEVAASTFSLANQLYEKGYWMACSVVRDDIDKTFKHVPYGTTLNGLLHFSHFRNTNLRWDSRYHGYKRSSFQLIAGKQEDQPPTLSGCMQLTSVRNGWETSFCKDALSVVQSVRPYALTLKRRWSRFA